MNTIIQKKIKIDDIIPDFLDRYGEFSSKSGVIVSIQPYEQEMDSVYKIKGKFIVHVNSISLRGKGLQGYEVKLQLIKDEVDSHHNELEVQKPHFHNQNSQEDQQRKSEQSFNKGGDIVNILNQRDRQNYNGKPNRFAFRFIDESMSYIGENIDKNILASSLRNDESNYDQSNLGDGLLTDRSRISQKGDQVLKSEENQDEKAKNLLNVKQKEGQREKSMNILPNDLVLNTTPDKMNYAQTINRTLRLVNGQYFDIEDLKKDEYQEAENDDEDENGSAQGKLQKKDLTKDPDKEVDGKNLKNNQFNIFKKQSHFVYFLENTQNSNERSISCFKWSGMLLILSLGILALVGYMKAEEQIQTIQDIYWEIQQSGIRQSETQRTLFKLFENRLINIGIRSNNSPELLQAQKKTTSETIISLSQAQEYLFNNQGALDGRQLQLFSQSTISVTNLETNGAKTVRKVDINQATSQVISTSFELMNEQITNYNDNNKNLFFLEYNLLNDLSSALDESTKLYSKQLQQSENHQQLYIFLFFSIGIALLGFMIITPIFSYISHNQEQILVLFLQIPNNQLQMMLSKCETFSNGLQLGEEENLQSEEDKLEQQIFEDESSDGISGRRSKQKKYQFHSLETRSFIAKFLISILFLEAYFIGNYFVTGYMETNLTTLVEELNSTVIAEPFYGFTNNVIRKILTSPDFSIQANSVDAFFEVLMDNLYDLNSMIQKQHSFNLGFHDSSYNDYYDQIMKIDACSEIEQLQIESYSECSNFSLGIMQQGLAVATSRHFQNIRLLTSLFKEIKQAPDGQFPNVEKGFIFKKQLRNDVDGEYQNQLANLLTLQVAVDIDQMQDKYIRSLMKSLIQQFIDSLQVQLNQNTTTRVTIFICFIVFLFIFFALFWMPLASKVQNQIKRTTNMLGIIPLSIIEHTQSIKDFLTRILQIEQ